MALKVRCAECAKKIPLASNTEYCICSVSSKPEPLWEHLVCGDFERVKYDRKK